ncbi:signal peptidase II [Anaerolineae bacterium]|nr:signal peptidase II [Anaerolineae bacterium]
MTMEHFDAPRAEEPRAAMPQRHVVDLALLVIALIILIADQASKVWVIQNIPLNTTLDIIPPLSGIFVLTHITNSGAAFGLFPQLSLVFTLIALAVSLVIVFYNRSIPSDQWLVRLSLGLQLGGALGNLVDRLRFGSVIDLLYVRYFPVFNIADSAIVCGVILLMWHLMRTPKPEPAKIAPNESSEKINTPGDGLG